MARPLLFCSLVAALLAVPALSSRASADEIGQSFTDVPLTLKPLHFSADAALGFGTYVDTSGSTQVGWGSTFSAAVGLPFIGELGATIAERFGNDGILVGTDPQGNGSPAVPTGADHFGRLFDPVVGEPGLAQNSAFANPEFHLRGTLLPLDVFELGLETRVIVPTSDNSYWAFTPGIPIRVHLPGILRIDTGLWLPIYFVPQQDQQLLNLPSTEYILDIPAAAYFQIGNAFVGPQTGLRFVNIGSSPNSTDIPLGVGGGYTFGGILDVKAQLRTERVNSSTWASQSFGGGIGVGLRLP